MLGACTGGYKVYRDCVVRLTGAAKGMTGKRQGQGFLRASSVNEINIVFKKKQWPSSPFTVKLDGLLINCYKIMVKLKS